MRYFLDRVDELPLSPETDWGVDTSKREFLIYSAALSCTAALGLTPETSRAAPSARLIGQLEHKIESYIKTLRKQGKIRADERTAWSVYDFTTRTKLVSINENVPYQSASMIKPFVALAFFYKVAQNNRRYRYDKKKRSIMEKMIRWSSNRATNYFIDQVGKKPSDVEIILKRQAPGIFRQVSIVEKIPLNGRTYRNKASAHDYSRFLYGLWYELFPFSDELKKLMNLPNKDRIYHGAQRIPRGTKVYDKTGSTARLCGNMGIVEARGRDGRSYPYTFVAIIEKAQRARNYGGWVRSRGNAIREVSNIVYSDLKKIHNLV